MRYVSKARGRFTTIEYGPPGPNSTMVNGPRVHLYGGPFSIRDRPRQRAIIIRFLWQNMSRIASYTDVYQFEYAKYQVDINAALKFHNNCYGYLKKIVCGRLMKIGLIVLVDALSA